MVQWLILLTALRKRCQFLRAQPDQFLADLRGMTRKNLAVELLRKLLNDEVKARSKHNLVQARSFADTCTPS